MTLKKSALPEAVLYGMDTLRVNIDRLRYLDGYLQMLVDKNVHPFIAFHALRRGVKIFGGNYGVQKPGGGPLREDAIFSVASVTKPFTATCLAILQEDGLVDFWEPVQAYFPEFEGEGKDGVLLWHLLAHVSGWDQDAAYEWAADYIRNELGIALPEDGEDQTAALMAAREKLGLPETASAWEVFSFLTKKAPLKTPIGTAFAYNSIGYEMLGQLVEKISGMSLEAFARQRVFDPLGMTDTHWALPRDKYDRYVYREPNSRGGNYHNTEEALQSTSAAGGLKTTIRDQLIFGQMFLQNGTLGGKRILSPSSVRLMTTDQNAQIPDSYWRERMLGSNWGFGWDVKNGKKDDFGMLRGDISYNHCGFGGARLHVDPEAELVIALYIVEQEEGAACAHMSTAANILYSALG
ncbi:MAG: beta-lactamase family protein [Clostridiales bacterium]|nr:beta-lactamase family protein [Clostridiales bacterium]